jgi:hypothetical protein
VLTWAVIPVLQGYAVSGAFSVGGRLWHSLKRLWVFYLVIGALAAAGVLGALAAGSLTLATLPALVFTLSNAYGLIVLVALLGYGLVEIPRIFWRRSWPETRLKWHYHRVGRAADRLTDASDELERVLAIVLATSQQVPRADAKLRAYMDYIIRCVRACVTVRGGGCGGGGYAGGCSRLSGVAPAAHRQAKCRCRLPFSASTHPAATLNTPSRPPALRTTTPPCAWRRWPAPR